MESRRELPPLLLGCPVEGGNPQWRLDGQRQRLHLHLHLHHHTLEVGNSSTSSTSNRAP